MPGNDTVVFPEPGAVTVEDRDVPPVGADEVLVETRRSLISTGTELTLLEGDAPEGSVWDDITQFPVVGPGYCAVGEVVERGSDVPDESVGVGDRVAVWEPHQRYSAVAHDECFPVPDGVDDTAAAFYGIGIIAMNGVRRGELEWGRAAAVYGLGLLGQFTVRFARIAGARPVVGFDLADDRLAYLPDDGAVTGADPTERDAGDAVRAATGGRLADVVFEVTGNPDAIPGEFDALREGGSLVLLSSPDGETSFDFHDHCNRGSYGILGAHVYGHADHPTPENPWTRGRHADLFFDLVAAGELVPTDLVTHTYDAADAADAYGLLLKDRTRALGVVLEW